MCQLLKLRRPRFSSIMKASTERRICFIRLLGCSGDSVSPLDIPCNVHTNPFNLHRERNYLVPASTWSQEKRLRASAVEAACSAQVEGRPIVRSRAVGTVLCMTSLVCMSCHQNIGWYVMSTFGYRTSFHLQDSSTLGIQLLNSCCRKLACGSQNQSRENPRF